MTAGAVRWEEVHLRLRNSEKLLAETLAGDAGRIEAVFRRRALDLAREDAGARRLEKPDPADAGFPALIFKTHEESCAIALEALAEIVPFRGCTPVPGSAAEVLGVINLRGDICPVIDLGHVLAGQPPADPGASGGFALVLRAQSPAGTPVVLKVEEASGLREVHVSELAAPAAGQFTRMLAGSNEPALSLLDAGVMLSVLFPLKESRIV